ncbi:hypothetical protein SPBR_01706 [Sporothrix brasiliensis 5110]|uniref:Uncharacterized protein n=1 Tax=Sporothrix brasiliensis 5110 TaxID=1398154 RepID=A0A0C2IRP8_9PEZI|nr:uncharacterized protein SPBR_01706 [Sporothrix brasiliensis 5110]KIH91696.1 hypothetical protein SPBR_01706 [Sporothrix brasiliensis 5110]
MSDQRPILVPLDLSNLLESGLASQAHGGVRKLHRRRTHASSDDEYRNLPLDATPTAASSHDNNFVEVPEHLISRATLTYVGYTDGKADELWYRWTHWPADGPRREVDNVSGELYMTFKDFITSHIGISDSFPDNTWGDQTHRWIQCLRRYGINEDTISAILEPYFENIRRTKTCAFWAKDTVNIRYAGIEEMSRESHRRAADHDSSTRRGHTTRLSVHQATSSPAAAASSDPTTTGSGATAIRVAIDLAARNAPGYTLLYRGMDKALTRGLFRDDGTVRSFKQLVSGPPTDFSGNVSKYYFTPQFQVAETDAAYTKNRGGCVAVVIVAIRVPNQAIQTLQHPAIQRLHWPNPDWANFVWHSRRNETLPKHLRTYRTARLLIGHIATHPNQVYERMESPSAISDADILRVEGRKGTTKAIQFVYSDDDDTREWLWENGAQTTKLFEFKQEDLEAVEKAMSSGEGYEL